MSFDDYRTAVLDRVIYERHHDRFVLDCWRYGFPPSYAIAWLQKVYSV